MSRARSIKTKNAWKRYLQRPSSFWNSCWASLWPESHFNWNGDADHDLQEAAEAGADAEESKEEDSVDGGEEEEAEAEEEEEDEEEIVDPKEKLEEGEYFYCFVSPKPDGNPKANRLDISRGHEDDVLTHRNTLCRVQGVQGLRPGEAPLR